MLAVIGLRWIGVSRACKVLTDEEETDTLYFSESCTASAERVFYRVRQLRQFVLKPTIEMLDMWVMAMGLIYDYEGACNQSPHTPMIQCTCVGEGCGTDLFCGRFGWSYDCEQSSG